MPKQLFVDFKAIKAAVTMEQLLEHYALSDQFKRSGDSLSGPCPIHKGSNPTQFRISVSKNIWHCFSKCQSGGNVLDFIAKIEDVSIHAAALKAIEWFHLDSEAMAANSDGETEKGERNGEAPKPALKPPEPENTAPNKPLKFRLEKLERQHPYLIERGLSLETVIDFGVGYCSKGMMAGRIAIPIHTLDGDVVAYVGRFPGEPTDDTPKYKLPPGFRKSLELYNIDRAVKEPAETPLVIVEGFYREELEDFFVSEDKVQTHLSRGNEFLTEKKARVAAHTRQLEKVRTEMRKVYDLYQGDKITPDGFGNLYRPLEDQEKSLATELPKLQGEVDALEIRQLSVHEIVSEATNLHRLWPKFTPDEKRSIVESITEKIVLSANEVDITFCNAASSEELTKRQRNLSGSLLPPT